MQKKQLFLGISLLALLASCGGSNNPGTSSSASSSGSASSSSVSPSSSEQSSSSTESSSSQSQMQFIEEAVYASLEKMKEGNFTLSYSVGNKALKDVVTSNYVYTGYLNSGSILLKTYAETPYAYDFTLNNGMIEVRGQTFNDEYTAQEVTTLADKNKFASYEKKDFSFYKEGDYLATKDSGLIDLFSAQLDFRGVKRILFSLKDGLVMATFQGTDSTGVGIYSTLPGGEVVIEGLGTSSLPEVDAYLKTFAVSSDSLSGKADNLFGNASFVSAIYDNLFLEEYNSIQRQGYSNLDVYGDYVRITDISEEGASNSITYHRLDEAGKLEIVGVNGKNEEESTPSSTLWSDFGFLGLEQAKLEQFRKLPGDDDYYVYLGSDATSLAVSITQHLNFKQWEVQEIKAKVVDGKVAQLIFSTGMLQDSFTGDYFYRYADTRVAETPNVISGAKKKEASTDDEEIKEYLSYLNQDDSAFTSVEVDSAWEGSRVTKISKGSDFYLKGTYLVSEGATTDKMESLGSGYYKKGDKVYSFTYDETGAIELNKQPVEKTLSSIANFSISSEVLFKNGDALQSYGDIINIGSCIGNIYNPLTVDPSSLTMSLSDGKISSMAFNYRGGSETVTFDYEAPILSETMKKALDEAIDGLDPSERATWADDQSQSVMDALISQYGEEKAKLVPFLYDQSFYDSGNSFDGWYCDYETEPYYFIVTMNSEMDASYAKKYKAYLKSLGYTSSDDETFVSESDGWKIVVNEENDDYEFLHIYEI